MICQIVFSPAGGTQRVADLFSVGWNPIRKIDLSIYGDDYSKYTFSPEDLCIFASPVYEGRIPPIAAQRISQLRGNGTPAVAIAVYGNRHYNDALIELGDLLTDCGFIPFAGITANAHHSSMTEIAVGRPDADDRRDLAAFAEKIQAKYESGEALTPAVLPGNRPYITEIRKNIKPLYPSFDADKCIGCMQCQVSCPAQAIPKEDPSVTDPDICCRCMRCTYVCPVGARYINADGRDTFLKTHMSIFAERKPNELWL